MFNVFVLFRFFFKKKGTKFPFIMKLCFSSSKSMNGAWNNAANEGMIEKENDSEIKTDPYN